MRAAAVDLDPAQAHLFVGVRELLRVRRPDRAVAPHVAVGGDAARLAAAVGGAHVDLVLAAGVGQVRDPARVRRPGHADLARRRRVAEVADRTVLGRHGPDLAARAEHRALAAGREAQGFDLRADVLPRRQRVRRLGRHPDRHLHRGGGAGVVAPDPAALLEHHRVGTARGPQHVEVVEGGDGARFAAPRRDRIQVERGRAVGGEVDRVADPGRLVVTAAEIGQAARGVARKVVHPHVLRAAAAVALPAAEVAVDRRVGELGAIGREAARARFGDRQRGFDAAVHRHQVRAPAALVEGHAVGAHQHLLAVRGPVQHPVVGAAAHRHRADVAVVGELARGAAGGRHHVHLARARVLGAERDPGPVRRELGIELEALVRGQALRGAAVAADEVQVPGVDEDDVRARDIGEAQQARLGVGRGGGGGDGRQGKGGGDQACMHGRHSGTKARLWRLRIMRDPAGSWEPRPPPPSDL